MSSKLNLLNTVYAGVLWFGQSNAESFSIDDNGSTNGIYRDDIKYPMHSRVFQFGRGAPLIASDYPNTGAPSAGRLSMDGKIILASDPLHHPRIWDTPSNAAFINSASGVGGARAFANRLVEKLPDNHRVCIIPCAWSSTSQATWKPTSDGTSFGTPTWICFKTGYNLFTDMIVRVQKFLALNPNNYMVAGAAFQGESDLVNGRNAATQFVPDQSAMIDCIRAIPGCETMPILWGPFTPTWTGQWASSYDAAGTLTVTSGNVGAYQDAIDTTTKNAKAYYGVTPRAKRFGLSGNTTTGAGQVFGGNVHWNAEAQWALGISLVEDALPAARANIAPGITVPAAPTVNAAGSVTSSSFSVSWTGGGANNVVLVRPAGTTIWTVAGSSASSPLTVSGLGNLALTSGVQYEYTVRAVSASGIPSAMPTAQSVTLSASTATSAAITPNSGISIPTSGTQAFAIAPTGGVWKTDGTQSFAVTLTNGGTINGVTNAGITGTAPNYTITPNTANTTNIGFTYNAPSGATTVTMATTPTGFTGGLTAGASISIGVVGVASSIAVSMTGGTISPSGTQAINLTPNGVWQAGNTATATLTGTPGGTVTAANANCTVTGSGPFTVTPASGILGTTTPMIINYNASTTTGTESVAISSTLSVTGSPASVVVSGIAPFPSISSATKVAHFDPNQNVTPGASLSVQGVGFSDVLTSSSSGVTVATNVQNSLSMFSIASTGSSGLQAAANAAWITATQNLSNSGAHTLVYVVKTKGTIPNFSMTYDFEGASASNYDEFDLWTSSNLVQRDNGNGTSVITGTTIAGAAINTLYKIIVRFNANGSCDAWVNGVAAWTNQTYTPAATGWTKFTLGAAVAAVGATYGLTNAYIGDFVTLQGAVSGSGSAGTLAGEIKTIADWMTTKWG